MKRIRLRKIPALILAVSMLLGAAAYSVAAQGRTPTVVFNAATREFSLENAAQYTDAGGTRTFYDLFTDFKNAMPGDTLTQTIAVRVENAGAGTVKLMLWAEDANEDYGKLTAEGSVESAAYPATLLTNIGGTAYSGTLTGTGSADGVYLGAYTGSSSEKEIAVSLQIPVEAGNELQGLTAELGWVFTAEIIPYTGGGDIEIPEEPVPKAALNTTDHYAYLIGRKDGKIHPEAEITRGEIAAIFFRMLTDESRDQYWSTSNSYTDIAPNLWCNNPISTLSRAGVLQGYSDGTFRPNASITRAEFAAIAVRFFQVAYDGPDQFSDILNSWAEDDINRAAAAGLIQGYEDGTFRPQSDITRAEAVTIVNRVLGRSPDKDHLLAGMITWPDNVDPSAWYYVDIQEATNSHQFDLEEDSDGNPYEVWNSLLPVRDWAAFEKEWADQNAAQNPGEIVSSITAASH